MYTRIFDALNYRKMLNWLPDKAFLKAAFRARFGRKLNLNKPETFNEKMQWMKLYNRKPEYTMMVDKYLVRNYVREKIGEKYLIPLLGVWDDSDKIDFDKLPMQFVLKCNHNSGLGMCICKNTGKLCPMKRWPRPLFRRKTVPLRCWWPGCCPPCGPWPIATACRDWTGMTSSRRAF